MSNNDRCAKCGGPMFGEGTGVEDDDGRRIHAVCSAAGSDGDPDMNPERRSGGGRP